MKVDVEEMGAVIGVDKARKPSSEDVDSRSSGPDTPDKRIIMLVRVRGLYSSQTGQPSFTHERYPVCSMGQLL